MRTRLLTLLIMTTLFCCACGQHPHRSGQTSGRLDSDGDGVSDALDRCEGTSTDRVTASGCPDDDLDGIEDEEDSCPNTPAGAPVDEEGCPFPTREFAPTGETRIRPLATVEEIDRFIFGLFRVPHPLNCPGDVVPPPTPSITDPAPRGIERCGFVVGGPNEITVRWTSVEDPCTPVRYNIEWEYRAVGLNGAWQPMMGFGKRMQDVNEQTIDWPLENTWARVRVWATDNNGHSSLKSPWQYILLSRHCSFTERFNLPRAP